MITGYAFTTILFRTSNMSVKDLSDVGGCHARGMVSYTRSTKYYFSFRYLHLSNFY